jgi:hypothetical protein
MSQSELITDFEESQLAHMLVQRKIINDAQLKTALDYQKSLGGKVGDVLCKLGLVRQKQIEDLLKNPGAAAGAQQCNPRETDEILNPDDVDPGELKVHHRLLAKLPRELVEPNLISLFFPVSKLCSRKLIVGHGKEVPREVFEKIQSLLGVEVCTVHLSEEVARRFLLEHAERQGARKPAKGEKAPAPPQPVEGVAEDRLLVKALAGLLIKKGMISIEELQVERQLLRQLKKDNVLSAP